MRLFRISVADTAGLIREFGQEAVLVDSLSKLEREYPLLAEIGCIGMYRLLDEVPWYTYIYDRKWNRSKNNFECMMKGEPETQASR